MAEPTIHTATVAVATPALALLFAPWPFALSFISGCIALIYLVTMKPMDAFKSVVAATFLGGCLSQLLAGVAISVLSTFNAGFADWGKQQDSKLIMIAILAIAIGLFIQHIMPNIIGRLGKEVDGK